MQNTNQNKSYNKKEAIIKFWMLFLSIFILIFSGTVLAIPNLINLQGRLTDTSGVALTGYHNLTFKIYNQSSNGALLWNETQSNVYTSSGLFNVMMGSNQSLNLSFESDYYLGITVDTDSEMSPRIRWVSNPYSFYAKRAENLTSVADNEIHIGNFSFTKIFVAKSSGNVGIGKLTPSVKLDVDGTINASELNITGITLGGERRTTWANVLSSGGNANFSLLNVSGQTLLATGSGNVGIGTTSPSAKLEVVGPAIIGGGLNASNLNVTGFSITDDSLVTLSDGSKKKIKDVKAMEEVMTLDEKTGKLVARKVNALLDHGIKPIYQMTTEDGRAINTTAEHPYLVKSHKLPDKIFKDSDGVRTLSGNAFFNPLSPERILQSNLRDKEMYVVSFSCGDILLASSVLSANLSRGINSISPLIKEKIFINSSLEKCENVSILSTLLPISKNKYSGEVNSNLLRTAFNSKTNNGLPRIKSAENIVLASTMSNIPSHSLRSLLAIAKLTSSANSFTCPSVAFDLETIDSISLILSNLSLKNLENISCQSTSEILLNSSLISSGISTFNSAILTSPKDNNENAYLNVSEDYTQWIEVRYLKEGDEIAVPNYETGRIKWEKIKSIKPLPPQHVYDLAIEDTRNFIANDIVAHNTYLATSSGNVGIGTTSPSHTLNV
ncbi:MAG: hypothetical protein AABY14_03595, partial [Nanoarchaeota archaeon]